MVFIKSTKRVVVLTKFHAIKIALLWRPLYPLTRVSGNLHQGGIRQLLEKIKADRNGGASVPGKIRFFIGLLFPSGIASNRREYELYSSHPELPIAPVLAMYLGGLVLVMERGQPATSEECSGYCHLVHGMDTDVLFQRHLYRFGSTIKTVDYGNPSSKVVLLQLFSGGT